MSTILPISTRPQSIQMCPWIIFGAKSHRGRLQGGLPQSATTHLDAFIAEFEAPRVDFETLGNSNICSKHGSALGPSKKKWVQNGSKTFHWDAPRKRFFSGSRPLPRIRIKFLGLRSPITSRHLELATRMISTMAPDTWRAFWSTASRSPEC